MNLEYPSLLEFGLESSADLLARAFQDYFVSIPFDVAMLLKLARADSVDLSLSRVIVRDRVAVGAALIARRGWSCRLAAMAIVPEARRAGLGRAIVIQLLDEAKARGDRTMVLEVIEQNTAAVELYRACGFDTSRRLIGFVATGGSSAPQGDDAQLDRIAEVDLREVARAITCYGLPDLPWQLSGETIAHLAPPAIAYHLDGAWIAITDPFQPVVTVCALVGRDSVEPHLLTALILAVIAKHPGKTEWRFQPKWPEELAPVIEPAGFARTSLTQWQMHRPI